MGKKASLKTIVQSDLQGSEKEDSISTMGEVACLAYKLSNG